MHSKVYFFSPPSETLLQLLFQIQEPFVAKTVKVWPTLRLLNHSVTKRHLRFCLVCPDIVIVAGNAHLPVVGKGGVGEREVVEGQDKLEGRMKVHLSC